MDVIRERAASFVPSIYEIGGFCREKAGIVLWATAEHPSDLQSEPESGQLATEFCNCRRDGSASATSVPFCAMT